MIEQAYRQGEAEGLAVWTEDEAGPFQTRPYPGASWQPEGEPARQPHEYFREGTAKLLNLFHPADGQVRMQGVTSSTNEVLHGWMQAELSAILATLPPPAPALSAAAIRAQWERWQEGLTVRVPLDGELPPLRMLLVLDNLAGHNTPSLQRWLVAQGILPLYTPLGGLLVEHGRECAADHPAAGVGRAVSADPARNHGLAGSDGPQLERRADALRVGRQARGAPAGGNGGRPWAGRGPVRAAPSATAAQFWRNGDLHVK